MLLAGELAIAYIEDTETHQLGTKFQNLPNIVMKVGDGDHTFSQLKFVSALAADVYGWAKGENPPPVLAGNIEGLSEYISGQIRDTDTRYTMVTDTENPYIIKLMATGDEKADTTYDDLIATIDLSTLDTRLKTVEGSLGENGSVSTQIQEAVEAIAVAETTIEVGKVIATYKQENGILTITTRDLTIADVADLQTNLDEKQDKLEIANNYNAETNKVATVETVRSMVGGLEGAMHFKGAAESDPLTWTDNAIYSAGDVVLWGDSEYVYNGANWLELGNTSLYKLKTEAANEHQALTEEIAKKQDKLPVNGTPSEENPVMTKGAVDTAIQENNTALTYGGGDAADGFFAIKVTQTEGMVGAEYGQVTTDHIQQGSLTLVLDCGTSEI